MALRAISIVSLEGTIRAQFDERLNEIQRSIQEQHGGETSTSDENQVLRDAQSPAPDTHSAPEPPDMSEDGDLGQIQSSHDRARSIDIRVEFDAFPDAPEPSEDGDSISESLRFEINRISRSDNRSLTCCQFYKSHWIGHMVSGILCGTMFLLLGVIFIANGKTFPIYAGIVLIILGLAPCCMALNKYRYARLYESERRRALLRLQEIRRAHRRNLREVRRMNGELHHDLPPAYDNLGFDLGEEDFDNNNNSSNRQNTSNALSSEDSFVLPTYDQCVKKEDETSVKDHSTSTEDLTMGEVRDRSGVTEGNNEESQELEFTEILVGNEQDVVVQNGDSAKGVEVRADFDSGASSTEEENEPQFLSTLNFSTETQSGESSL